MPLTGRGALVLAAALLAAAGTARLGLWQLHRADEKTALQRAMQAKRVLPPLAVAELPRDAAGAQAQQHRGVRLQGKWLASASVYLENRQMNGRPGFYAVTPLLLDDGSAVLVQRGWLPRDAQDRMRVKAPPLPAGRVEVQGRIAPALARLFDFADPGSGAIRQNLDIDAYAREARLPLRPLAVVQEDGGTAMADGLLRQWYEPVADVSRNHGYAVQWFALSALIIGLYAWFQLIRPQQRRRAARA